MKRLLILLLAVIGLCAQLSAQQLSPKKMELGYQYIAQYKDLAIQEMHKFGIPASITLAQALHESDFGRSRLARLANNHFGAKSHNTWQGPSILHDDDKPQEKFRKYQNVAHSYQDHSMVLMKSRYAFLFKLNKHDYKSWAHGLKKAGYATDPNYGPKLIKIIETFNLSQYDYPQQIIVAQAPKIVKKKKRKKLNCKELSTLKSNQIPQTEITDYNIPERKIVEFVKVKPMWVNSRKALIFPHNVTAKQVAQKYKLDIENLVEHNYLTKTQIIQAGTPIYLEQLRKKLGSFNNDYHTTKRGENLKDIAILYGVQLKKLQKLNDIDADMPLQSNQQIGLRKKSNETLEAVKNTPALASIKHKKPSTLKYPTKSKFIIANKRPIKKIIFDLSEPAPEWVRVVETPAQTINNFDNTIASTNNAIFIEEPKTNAQPHYHKVEPGQTLYRLSVIYDTDVDTIRTLNQLNDDVIQIGRLVRVR